MKHVKSKALEWALILAGVVLGIVFNNRGLLGWLPIIANLEYSIVAVFRNLAAMKHVKSKALEWALILAGVVLGIVFNNRGLLGWLPIIANLEYSIAVFKLKENETALKLAFIINMAMYAVFSLAIMNYVGAVSCTVIAVTTAVSVLRAKNG